MSRTERVVGIVLSVILLVVLMSVAWLVIGQPWQGAERPPAPTMDPAPLQTQQAINAKAIDALATVEAGVATQQAQAVWAATAAASEVLSTATYGESQLATAEAMSTQVANDLASANELLLTAQAPTMTPIPTTLGGTPQLDTDDTTPAPSEGNPSGNVTVMDNYIGDQPRGASCIQDAEAAGFESGWVGHSGEASQEDFGDTIDRFAEKHTTLNEPSGELIQRIQSLNPNPEIVYLVEDIDELYTETLAVLIAEYGQNRVRGFKNCEDFLSAIGAEE